VSAIDQDTRLPCKPQYIRVELDEDMAPEGPLRGGRWPGRERVLTFHFFPSFKSARRRGRKLKAGDRVCINAGLYAGCFGTVLGRSWRWTGYTYGVRRTRKQNITVQVTVDKTAEFEVA
jgi:hypothetical protein